jgi:hypothetical protein
MLAHLFCHSKITRFYWQFLYACKMEIISPHNSQNKGTFYYILTTLKESYYNYCVFSQKNLKNPLIKSSKTYIGENIKIECVDLLKINKNNGEK